MIVIIMGAAGAGKTTVATRLGNRPGHFAGPAIVSSQLETLERPRDALTLGAGLPVAALVEAIRTHLGR